MIKLVNLIVPKKEYITKKRDLICSTLSISILLLVILNIYFFKKLNLTDKILNYSSIALILSGMYFCLIDFQGVLVMFIHYLLMLLIWLVLIFSNNLYLLSYFLIVIGMIFLGWKINNNICMFGRLSWDLEIFDTPFYTNKNGNIRVFMDVLIYLYTIKIIYYALKYKKYL